MCEAVFFFFFFSNLATARVRVVQGFSNEKLFYESARHHELEEKKETEAPFFRATTQSARPFFKNDKQARQTRASEHVVLLGASSHAPTAENIGIPEELQQFK